MEEDIVAYVTKSGRISKKIVKSYFDHREKKLPTTKMPMVPREKNQTTSDKQQRDNQDLLEVSTDSQTRQNEPTKNQQSQGQDESEVIVEQLRQQLEIQRREMEHVKAMLNAHIGTQQVSQQSIQTRSNETTLNINELLNNMNYTNIDIKLPKFSDENNSNPLDFLSDIERFFTAKNIKNERKLSIIEIALENKARLWLDLRNRFNDFEQFKVEFLGEFYSVPIQIKVKNRWANRRYRDSDGDFQTFFYRQLKEATYILPRLCDFERNFIIIQQFPFWIKESLASINYENTNNIGQTLAQLDAINTERRWIRERRNQNNVPIARYNQTQVRQLQVHQGRGNGRSPNTRCQSQYYNNSRGYRRQYYNPRYRSSVPRYERAQNSQMQRVNNETSSPQEPAGNEIQNNIQTSTNSGDLN